eukprot:TRINITY_DN87645_c0_g1_i1.p1 TRINITY_DN87645_c0_g1~~TRINITY_DN87645_c0_g1_i1.p1  ORF type:complete len:494 (-),score=76.70 TRINITY_DN87645_c0_g1_i1:87-1568(-)
MPSPEVSDVIEVVVEAANTRQESNSKPQLLPAAQEAGPQAAQDASKDAVMRIETCMQPPAYQRRRWLDLALCCFATMANQIVWVTFAPNATNTCQRFGVSIHFVNSLSMLFMLLYLPCTFPASAFIESHGCRLPLLLGAGLTAVGASLRIAALPDWVPHSMQVCGLFCGQALAAIGQPLLSNLPPKLAHTLFPCEQWVIADTIVTASASVGVAIGSILATSFENFEQLLAAESLITAAVFLLGLALFRSDPSKNFDRTEATANPAMQVGVLAASKAVLRDQGFRTLWLAFSFSLGTFNALCTVLQQVTEPFGFIASDASTAGATTVLFGLIGAGVLGMYLDRTHQYRLVLRMCFSVACFSVIAFAVLVPFGRGVWFGMMLACAVLGAALVPVMPISFEASAALMSPPFGETVLSGLCMAGGQVVGIAIIAIISLTADNTMFGTYFPLWLCAFGVVAGGAVAILSGFDEEVVKQRRTSANGKPELAGKTECSPL